MRTYARTIRYAVEYALLRTAAGLAGGLPLPMAGRLVTGVADLLFAVGGSRRRTAVDNILKAGIRDDGDAAIDEAYELCGDYVLRTDQAFPADVLWNLYMTLLKAEEGFKMLKGTLGLRPNFHQKEHRVDGHIFISVLAYHLLCWISRKIEAAGDNRTWRTLRRLLQTHCLLTTRLPLEDGRIISIRKASVPDEDQARIYQMLEINWRTAYKTRRTQIKG